MIDKFDIKGPVLISNKVFKYDRDSFFESFHLEQFEKNIGEKVGFVQDNLSVPKLNVVRGLHFQKPSHSQGRLARVLKGKVIDIALDIRKGFPTYGQHISALLSSSESKMFWISPGFAHDFSALTDDVTFSYKCKKYYHSESKDSWLWCDEKLNIDWKVKSPILSSKDELAQSFNTFKTPFN